jgi:thiol-disulfide isomerase/thioredoxin
MGGKAAMAGGLLAGIVVGVVGLGAVVLLTPGPNGPAVASDPTATPIETPVRSAASPSGAASPGGSPSIAPSGPVASLSPSPTEGDSAFGVGEPAPALRVPRVGGGEIDLAALRGTPVWVNFMATWCAPCRDELPQMTGFAERYADTGLVVVAIDIREDAALVDAFAKEVGVTFPVGLDTDGSAQRAWGAYALPVHFWIDKDGIVRDGALGGIGPDVMADALERILPGVDVTPS